MPKKKNINNQNTSIYAQLAKKQKKQLAKKIQRPRHHVQCTDTIHQKKLVIQVYFCQNIFAPIFFPIFSPILSRLCFGEPGKKTLEPHQNLFTFLPQSNRKNKIFSSTSNILYSSLYQNKVLFFSLTTTPQFPPLVCTLHHLQQQFMSMLFGNSFTPDQTTPLPPTHLQQQFMSMLPRN